MLNYVVRAGDCDRISWLQFYLWCIKNLNFYSPKFALYRSWR